MVTIAMVGGIGGMVNCMQRTITYSDSMYGVEAAVEATKSQGSL